MARADGFVNTYQHLGTMMPGDPHIHLLERLLHLIFLLERH